MNQSFDDDGKLVAALSAVTTASLTSVLFKKGLRNVWVCRARPLDVGQQRVVGRAFTMRFIPGREDLADPRNWNPAQSTRTAIEEMPDGCIAVVDAMGVSDVGILGDILCARMRKRVIAGLLTDGVIRDVAGVRATELPVWCNGVAAPAPSGGLTYVSSQEPIACGGVAVFPGDMIVMDEDGAVLIPCGMVEEVTALAVEQERLESWVMEQVASGLPLPG
ncbi:MULTISPECIES: ribonuclease activity regulator RraA [unclassified Klebsiella]|uniref:ribonuclease activity regulator RraA n=1 Tax=unclassified Klebsiella TaxID=2608929 RepID=UPI000C29B213|nr:MULTISPECIES: ribonuclease activity regulator RraA [unclassified Klebsiella]PJX55976.1 ribonuclease activity regulator RraA [Klebsiella sp. F-Nf9]PKJ69893.1 ribonuclease activity regulator RraA [Klebsiella sp. X1-16S-Nf21]